MGFINITRHMKSTIHITKVQIIIKQSFVMNDGILLNSGHLEQ